MWFFSFSQLSRSSIKSLQNVYSSSLYPWQINIKIPDSNNYFQDSKSVKLKYLFFSLSKECFAISYFYIMSKALSEQELHNLAMNTVGKDLEERGFEFIAINSKLKKHPQFVCIDKNKQYFFVIVKAVILPENPNNFDIIWMESFKKHAREQDAKVLYAGVGLGNPNGEDLPVYLNEEYLIEYNGIQVVETNLN